MHSWNEEGTSATNIYFVWATGEAEEGCIVSFKNKTLLQLQKRSTE